MMKEYEFTLKFMLQDASIDPASYIERLGDEGCDDALVGIGQTGRIALTFIRAATSAYKAISSAIRDVKRAIPEARLIEATPDLVGLTDVAELLGFSRQNMRKLMLAGGGTFPAPRHDGKPAIWHLVKVLTWLKERNKYQIDDRLLEVSGINMQLNIVKEISEVDPDLRDDMRALVA